MVKTDKHITVEVVEEKQMPVEAFSVVTQLLANWIVREMQQEANKGDENTLTSKPSFYTIPSKKI